MPSSTSSSNDRLPSPQAAWLPTTALMLCGLLGLYELALRSSAIRPSVTDDARLWSLARHDVRPGLAEEVILIGASRIQADIDGDVFADVVGGEKPKQLGIAGSSPIPVLKQIADDKSFRGLVICDVMPIYFFTGIDAPQGRASEFLAQAERDWPWDVASTRLRASLESCAAFRASDAAPSVSKLLDLIALRLRLRQHTLVDAERYTRIYRTPADVQPELVMELARLTEESRPVAPEQLDRDFARINEWVKQIRARGGEVMFVVLPVTGLRREAEERRFPRADYWDRFQAAVDADAIHFQDYPELAHFECFDGSHLNVRAATDFTRAFALIVRERIKRKARELADNSFQ